MHPRLSPTCILVLAAVLPAGAQLQFTVTAIGTLGGSYSSATGINSANTVVGCSAIPNTVFVHAFRWTRSGGIQDLGTLSGGSTSGANAVNDAGQIVGSSDLGQGILHAFLWTSAGGMQDLGTLTGSSGQSEAFAINSAGVIAGESLASDGTSHVVTWTNGVIQDLGALPHFASGYGFAVNDKTQIAGTILPGNSLTDAFSWTGSGGFVNIGKLPGGTTAAAYGINSNGAIVGSADVGDKNFTHAILWTATVGLQDLGTLTAGGSDQARAINDRGQVVGIDSGSNGIASAFLYTKATLMWNLNLLIRPGSGWQLQSANAINNKGFIAATGVFQSVSQAALLTPK